MRYIFANWKMYLNYSETGELANKLVDLEISDDIEVGVFPNSLAFSNVLELVGKNISLGAQNVSWTPQGAYTGAVSAWFFKEVGAKYALIGHSERRYIFGETDQDIKKKIEACFDSGLIPVLCIGDTAEDKENGKSEYRIKKQLMKAFEGLGVGQNQMIIAYEPVWAISKAGQGEDCGSDQAKIMHDFISQELKNYTDLEFPIIYGGSVKSENVESYLREDSISGVLVGNASTKFESFSEIVEITNKIVK